MAERLRESFKNPYVEDDVYDARFRSVVSMDEAHERWLQGSWRAKKANFEIDPSLITGEDMSPTESEEEQNRFAFDLQSDIINADMDSDRLDGISYDASYRPQGVLSNNISNLAIDRMRYNALADIQEELPEDLNYLYGGGSGRSSHKRRTSFRKHSHRPNETLNNERRSHIDKLLAQYENTTSLDDIIKDVREHREIEAAKSGVSVKRKSSRSRLGIYDVYGEPGTVEGFSDAVEEYLRDEVNDRGSQRCSIPTQPGLVPDTQMMPRFGRFSRTWSEMEGIQPTRREMLRHTVNTIYEDDNAAPEMHEKINGGREYYVDDSEYDPYDMYRPLPRPRMVKTAQGGNIFETEVRKNTYSNPYADISNDRIMKMLDNDMHGPGHLQPPEGITDPSLIYEWNMGYGRVNPSDNRYTAWITQQGEMAQNAEQSRYRGSHRTGRPGAYIQRERPYGPDRRYPRGQQRDREQKRRDMEQQLRAATEKGIRDGREMIRRQQDEERKRYAEYCVRQQEMYKKQQEQMAKQQREYYERQQAVMKEQQQKMQGSNGQAQPNAGQPPQPQFGPWGYYTAPANATSDKKSRP